MVSGIFIFDLDRQIMEIMPIHSSTLGQMGIDGVVQTNNINNVIGTCYVTFAIVSIIQQKARFNFKGHIRQIT